MKLNLGCGESYIDGFINIDIRQLSRIDDIDDITTLKKYKKNSIELIYASHVLEHIDRNKYIIVLKRWFDLLNTGGILRLAVPDMEQVFNHYNKYKDLQKLYGFIWGGQTYLHNYHYIGWDFKSLQNDLIKVGFNKIYRYDWRNTDHSHIDDYSQSYLPHLDKDNGTLMSLNVEAVKI